MLANKYSYLANRFSLMVQAINLKKIKIHIQESINDLREYKNSIVEKLRDAGKEDLINKVEQGLDDVESYRLSAVMVGEVNVGKSSTLRLITGNEGFEKNPYPGTWEGSRVTVDQWTVTEDGVTIMVVDSPGLLGDNPGHKKIAREIVNKSDLAIWCVYKPLVGEELVEFLKEILANKKRVIICINKLDIQTEEEIATHYEVLKKNFPEISENDIVQITASPLPVLEKNGVKPSAEQLTDKILEIARQDYDEIIQTKLDVFHNEMTQEMATIIREIQEKAKADLIEREFKRTDKIKWVEENTIKPWAVATAAGSAVLPVLVDVAGFSVLLWRISADWELEADVPRVLRDIIAGIGGAMLINGATIIVTFTAISVAARASIIFAVAGMTLDFVLTYFLATAIGAGFNEYCANRGSWGSFGDAKGFYRNWLKKHIKKDLLDKIPTRFRGKLESQIDPSLL